MTKVDPFFIKYKQILNPIFGKELTDILSGGGGGGGGGGCATGPGLRKWEKPEKTFPNQSYLFGQMRFFLTSLIELLSRFVR